MAEMTQLGKKGIFFTFISLIIMAIIILVYTPQADITIQKDAKAAKSRIGMIDSYVSDLRNDYMVTVLEATTQKALSSLVVYANKTGSPIKNFDAAFAEVMINGTVDGVEIDSITGKKIMDNNTLTNWSDRMIAAGSDTFSINASLIPYNVLISQSNPWGVDVNLILGIDVKSDLAEWKIGNVSVRASVSIEDFDDPFYIINTEGKYSNKIRKSSLDFDQWNLTFTGEHIRNGTYVHWQESDAPSFIMRFSNTTANSSCCGIESLVNPNRVVPNDQIESYVDYLFWNQTYISECNNVYNVTNPLTGHIGLWDEFRFFKLDVDHITKYNITSEYAINTC